MTTTEYLQREIRRAELSIRRAERKPNTPPEELRGLHEKLDHLQEALEVVNEHWKRVHEQRGWTAGEPLTLEQLRGAPHGKIRDKTLQHICVRANELAQAHSPAAHIDRDKWGPCKICGIRGMTEALILKRERFCAHCGRPLTEEAWAELERRVFK